MASANRQEHAVGIRRRAYSRFRDAEPLPMLGHSDPPHALNKKKVHREKTKVLNGSFFLIWLLYALLAICGYAVYGEKTKVLLTGVWSYTGIAHGMSTARV